MSRETWHWVLTLLGAGLEIVGLTMLVVDASRARRVEFGELGVVRRTGRRIWNWFAYWLGPPTQPANLRATVSGRGSLTATLTAAGVANETEMQRLRRELDDLGERLRRLEQEVARRLSEVEERIQRAAGEMGERIEQVEAQQRALRRASLRQEVRGARLFILGAVLSAVANLV